MTKNTGTELRTTKDYLMDAWDSFMNDLSDAREWIDGTHPSIPQSDDRGVAEGYRYLAGFVHHAVERAFHENPNQPEFRNALSVFNKATIDNPDAIYFYAPIDGNHYYKIEGCPANIGEHGRDSKEPRYIIFEVTNGTIAGDSGQLSELAPGTKQGFGVLDSSTIKKNTDGTFEILLGPNQPSDYAGNFICTKKSLINDQRESLEYSATYVSGRQLFYDWSLEEPIRLNIQPLDKDQKNCTPFSPIDADRCLRRAGSIVKGQMSFWLQFYDVVLNANERYESSHSENRYFMPVNSYNEPNAASSDTGGGMSTNIYAGAIFELKADEALLVEASVFVEPLYFGIHLGNQWGESPDYANHHSSLNGHQTFVGEDGIQRWVISHTDPYIQNWIDTTGLKRGFIANRWAYSEGPKNSSWPKISAKLIRQCEIDEYIPHDMPRLTEEERKDIIEARRRHIQKRYRAF